MWEEVDKHLNKCIKAHQDCISLAVEAKKEAAESQRQAVIAWDCYHVIREIVKECREAQLKFARKGLLFWEVKND